MRMSQLFSQTLREAPAEAELPSHQLLLRAGFIRQLAAGIFTLLPLGRRSQAKVETILRQEMEAIGGQEVSMPIVEAIRMHQKKSRKEAREHAIERAREAAQGNRKIGFAHGCVDGGPEQIELPEDLAARHGGRSPEHGLRADPCDSGERRRLLLEPCGRSGRN